MVMDEILHALRAWYEAEHDDPEGLVYWGNHLAEVIRDYESIGVDQVWPDEARLRRAAFDGEPSI